MDTIIIKIMGNENIVKKRKQLLQTIKDATCDQQTLADKLGYERSNINRMLNAHYSPTLDNFIKLCEATGLKIKLDKK